MSEQAGTYAFPADAQYLAPGAAERQLEEKLKRSHRWALLFTFGPLAAIVAVGLFSLLQVRSASAVVGSFANEIARADGGSERGNELERLQALAGQFRAMREQLAVRQAQVLHLEQRVTFMQGVGAQVESRPDRCGMPRPKDTAWVFFGSDNADITPTIEAYLDQYVASLGAQSDLAVHAYTDASGGQKHNKALSLRRAQSIANYLQAAAPNGIRVQTFGHGIACERQVGEQLESCDRVAVIVRQGAEVARSAMCGR